MERAVPYQVLRHAPSAKSSYPSNFPTSRDTRGASASHSELDVRTFSSKTWLELFPVRLTRDRQRSSLCWGADTRYSESFLDTSCDPPAFRLSLQPLQRHLDVRRRRRQRQPAQLLIYGEAPFISQPFEPLKRPVGPVDVMRSAQRE